MKKNIIFFKKHCAGPTGCKQVVELGDGAVTIQRTYGANEVCNWLVIGQPGTAIEAEVSEIETDPKYL